MIEIMGIDECCANYDDGLWEATGGRQHPLPVARSFVQYDDNIYNTGIYDDETS
jgi:hypothetical protein